MIEWLALSLLVAGQVVPCDTVGYSHPAMGVEFEKAIEARICQPLEDQYESINLTVLAVRGRSPVIDESPERDISRWSSTPLRAGRIKLQHSLERSRNTIIWFKVEATKVLWVSRSNLPPGTKIIKKMIAQELVDVGPYVGVKPIFTGSPLGLYLEGSHTKGSPFVEGELREPPLSERSEVVTVSYKKKNFVIELSGVLLENAWEVGDIVQVRLVRGNKVIKSVVTGVRNVSAVL
jgi:flagella basal body P-ring formation protein FlgA